MSDPIKRDEASHREDEHAAATDAAPPASKRRSLQPIAGARRSLRRRLTLKDEFVLATLPTVVVLSVLGLIEAVSQQRVLFASLASSAFLIYLDPQHAANSVRSIVLSHLAAAATGALMDAGLGAGYPAAGAAMVVTIVVMIAADAVHPPAVATALSFAFRPGDVAALWLFLLCLAVIAILVGLQRLMLRLLATVTAGRGVRSRPAICGVSRGRRGGPPRDPTHRESGRKTGDMFTRLTTIWMQVRDSLWFIPAALTSAAAILAIGLVQFESAYDVTFLKGEHWLIGGSTDGAREVLSTIAGSLITVTGVVFSVTIVALQLASSQFTPRILRNFTADRSNQVVLGVFIATFTYTLLVLRVVRSIEEEEEFVPHLSVSLAIVLTLVSIGFLIHFIHHSARSVQPSVILDRITAEALAHVKKLFPQEIGEPDESPPTEEQLPSKNPQVVAAADEGYLEAVDGNSLFRLGEQKRLLIRMAQPVGAFLVRGAPLAHVWADEPLADGVHEPIRRAFVLGPERTPEQDLEFLLIEVADMAVKALSPSINDPTTALHCIDRLQQILSALGRRRPPAPLRTQSGQIHFLAMATTFDSALEISFSQILHFGRGNPLILERLGQAASVLEELLPAERHASLRAFRARLNAAGRADP